MKPVSPLCIVCLRRCPKAQVITHYAGVLVTTFHVHTRCRPRLRVLDRMALGPTGPKHKGA